MSRAGYKGKHGNFEIPGLGKSKKNENFLSEDKRIEQEALYMQATVGDHGIVFLNRRNRFISDGNKQIRCAREWEKLMGMIRIDAQRLFIKNTNKLLTRYGWNPPEGWY